jgi:hypothetical protein
MCTSQLADAIEQVRSKSNHHIESHRGHGPVDDHGRGDIGLAFFVTERRVDLSPKRRPATDLDKPSIDK